MGASHHAHLVAALDACRGDVDHGFTFLGRDGTSIFTSFDALRRQAMSRAAIFRMHGAKPGDRVAIVMPQGEDFVPTFLGAIWAGLIPVPLYPPLSLGKLDAYMDTLLAILQRAEPLLVAADSKISQLLWATAARVPSVQGLVTSDELSKEAPIGAPQHPANVQPEDIAFLQFTSGSTSLPKGVEVTHANLQANAWAIMRDGLQTDSATDRGVSWLPLYHDMGLIGFVIAPIFHRVQVTFIPTMSFVRNSTIWLETIHAHRGTITFAPNFAYALVAKRVKPEQLAKWDLSCVKAFGCGAEPIHPETMRAFVNTFESAGVRPTSILPSYGMAECTLAICFSALGQPWQTDRIGVKRYEDDHIAERASDGSESLEVVSCGTVFKNHELAAFDERGTRLPDRHVGELWIRGPSVARGYYKNPDATAATFGGGWLRSGDYGYLDAGQIHITGRKKDIIIINGRNYAPQRIEWLVEELPGIRRGSTVAFSRPGPASEELVLVAEHKSADPTALKENIRQRITEQFQLTCADVVLLPTGALPKTSSGKLQRQKTRAQYLHGTLGAEGVRTMGAAGERAAVVRHFAWSLVGRGRLRARRVWQHTAEIRTFGQAVDKLKLARSYTKKLVGKLLKQSVFFS